VGKSVNLKDGHKFCKVSRTAFLPYGVCVALQPADFQAAQLMRYPRWLQARYV